MKRRVRLSCRGMMLGLGILSSVSFGVFSGVSQERSHGDAQTEPKNSVDIRPPAVGTRPQRVTTHYHIIPGDQSSTSWSAAVPTLLAVIVGGLISLFGVWLKDARDKRRAVQEWVEEEFVFGGIEPVIRTLDRVRLILLQREVSLVRVEPVGDFPVTELAKLRIIIGSDGLSAFIQVLGRLAMRATENGRRSEEIANIAAETRSHLSRLEKLLLIANLRKKGSVYNLAERESFPQIAGAVESSCRKLEVIWMENQTV